VSLPGLAAGPTPDKPVRQRAWTPTRALPYHPWRCTQIGTQPGEGGFVRGRPAHEGTQRTGAAHAELELPEAELSGELVQVGVKAAPPHVRTLLTLQLGAEAFLRRRLLTEDGEPVELASAWLPPDIAAGTDLASPELLNESIRHHLQTRMEIRIDHAVERITARYPASEEAQLLQVPADAPVLSLIVTVYDAAARPVQVSDLVLPGQRHELRDAYPFT
jgi:DNA-binding GntR family transcriptional regulator